MSKARRDRQREQKLDQDQGLDQSQTAEMQCQARNPKPAADVTSPENHLGRWSRSISRARRNVSAAGASFAAPC
jgi:hypothetical protein